MSRSDAFPSSKLIRTSGRPGDRVQDPVERVDRDPVALLARLERPLGRADPVEADAADDRVAQLRASIISIVGWR